MDLKIIITDVMTGERSKVSVRLNEDATISELFQRLEQEPLSSRSITLSVEN